MKVFVGPAHSIMSFKDFHTRQKVVMSQPKEHEGFLYVWWVMQKGCLQAATKQSSSTYDAMIRPMLMISDQT